MAHWTELPEWIHLGDVLDVTLVSVIAYFILGAFASIRARVMFSLIAGLVALDFIATHLGMLLTAGVMRAGSILLLVAVAVAFRDDVRAAVQRLTAFAWLRPTSQCSTTAKELLVATMRRLASDRTGALIVLPGRESLETHLHGGVELDGRLSQPLLESLFDPGSIGHDGAVIVDRDRVLRFGVHLPLSKNTGQDELIGTRHAAALGLSERCDALVIVVSEERGEISVAKGGHLERGLSEDELAAHLADHVAPRSVARASALFSFPRAAASVAVAMLLWLGFVYQEGTAEQTIELPIEYTNVPGELVVVEPKVSKVEVTLSGRRAAFDDLDLQQSLRIDLGDVESGWHEAVLDQSNLSLPPSLEVQRIEPPTQRLRIAKTRIEVRAVRVAAVGLDPALSVEVQPSSVRLLVPIGVGGSHEPIKTAPVDLTGVDPPATFSAKLVLPPNVRMAEGEVHEVEVHVRRGA